MEYTLNETLFINLPNLTCFFEEKNPYLILVYLVVTSPVQTDWLQLESSILLFVELDDDRLICRAIKRPLFTLPNDSTLRTLINAVSWALLFLLVIFCFADIGSCVFHTSAVLRPFISAHPVSRTAPSALLNKNVTLLRSETSQTIHYQSAPSTTRIHRLSRTIGVKQIKWTGDSGNSSTERYAVSLLASFFQEAPCERALPLRY